MRFGFLCLPSSSPSSAHPAPPLLLPFPFPCPCPCPAPAHPSCRCLNPACQAVRQYDGFADCIINVDNRALFTWELCISYCNEFATRAKVTFFGFW